MNAQNLTSSDAHSQLYTQHNAPYFADFDFFCAALLCCVFFVSPLQVPSLASCLLEVLQAPGSLQLSPSGTLSLPHTVNHPLTDAEQQLLAALLACAATAPAAAPAAANATAPGAVTAAELQPAARSALAQLLPDLLACGQPLVAPGEKSGWVVRARVGCCQSGLSERLNQG